MRTLVAAGIIVKRGEDRAGVIRKANGTTHKVTRRGKTEHTVIEAESDVPITIEYVERRLRKPKG